MFQLDIIKCQHTRKPGTLAVIVKGSGGQFTVATFIKGDKKFIIGYRFSIGYVVYQCDTSQVSHDFYLDGLGYAEQKQFPDF